MEKGLKKRISPAAGWFLAGVVIMVCTLGVVIFATGGRTGLLVDTRAMEQSAEDLFAAIRTGEPAAVSEYLAGQPQLGEPVEQENTAGSKLYYAFLDSLTWEQTGACRADREKVALEGRVRCLDLSAVLEKLNTIAPALLEERGALAEDESEIYDDDHNYREDFLSGVLADGTAQALKESDAMLEMDITLTFLRTDGGWKIELSDGLVSILGGCISGWEG